jgi:hypothetical protein
MSEVKVNKLSPRSGTTVTIGDSGDTISIPSGVTLDASSGGLAGTLTTAAQPNITSVGTLTSFTSTGIDDNADATAITIDSSERVGIGVSSPQEVLHLKDGDIAVGNGTASNNAVIGRIGFSTDSSNSRFIGIESFRGSDAANADLRFHTFGGDSNSGERMRIDNSGNVGIGNTVASTINSANGTGNLVVGSGSGTEGITIYSGTTGEGTLQFADGTSGSATYIGQINYNHSNNDMSFTSGGTEAMRINSSGFVLIGTTSQLYHKGVIQIKGAASADIAFIQAGSNGESINFRNASGTSVGSITVNASSTAYNTSSDYRLKENVNYNFDATTRLKQLKPARFNWIADDTNTLIDGFIAHEVSSVVPEAVSGTKDAVDENNNPLYQGIDQAKLVPLLVKTIQELEARITALEANNL